MSTETLNRPDTFTIDMTQFEEAKPCEAGSQSSDPCEHPAKWAVWAAHTSEVCPLTVNLCDDHKKGAVHMWEHYLKCPNHMCPRCKIIPARKGGQLDNWIRVIEL